MSKNPMNEANASNAPEKSQQHFIQQYIAADIAKGRYDGKVHTRFPPEPNGYLHIGHAKAICIDFGMAAEFGGVCNLRFDDTNPVKEDTEFVNAIMIDIKWLGWDWENRLYYASDYFDTLYEYALKLIRDGLAYVDDLTAEEIRQYRGTLTKPGKESPFRNRSVEENLELFKKMRQGDFEDGAKVLRAKIDMAHPNLNMRDPVMYRILRATHHRTGDAWLIYPTYDFTHGQSDSMEGITHSLCDLDFENHRPLYDWFCVKLGIHHPQQIEFARLNLTFTITSKRNLVQLVENGHVTGWDDPRMPTLSGLRRLGYTPESIRNFMEKIGVTKYNSLTDYALLEHTLRDDLNKTSPRVMAVLDPVKVVVENYPEDLVEELEAVNNPEDPSAGKRKVPFSRELYIERSDFLEDAPRKFFRLTVGREVRLRWAYFVTCTGFKKDPETEEIIEVTCTYDPATKGGDAPDGRRVKGTIHWVSAAHAIDAEVRLYDRLFVKENPRDVEDGKDYTDNLNPDSLVVTTGKLEPSLSTAKPGDRVQFERIGYFCVDSKDSTPDRLVLNRTVPLRDSWSRKANHK